MANLENFDVDSLLRSIIEDLAASEHERWAHWQSYMHQQGERREDGSIVLPPDLVAQWDKQIETAYPQLSEREKESDREQVQRYLPIIAEAVNRRFKSGSGTGPDQ